MAQRSFYRSNASNQTLLPPTSGPLGHNDEGDPDSNKVCEEISRGSIGINNEMSFIKRDQRFTVSPPEYLKGRLLFVTRYLGEPVMLEYDGKTKKRKRHSELTYPPSDHKEDFYKVGDIIMGGKYDKNTLYKVFPELAKPTKEHESILFQFIWAYFMGPPKKYQTAYSIKSISPYHDSGNGEVVYQGVLILENQLILLEKTLTFYNSYRLTEDWGYRIRANVGDGAETMALIMLEVLQVLPTAGATLGKEAVKKGVKKVMVKTLLKHTAKRSLQRKIWLAIKKDLAQNFSKAATAAVVEYIKKIIDQLKNTRILDQLDLNKKRTEKEKLIKARNINADIRLKIITPAIHAAILVFAATLVSESLNSFFSKEVSKGIGKEIKNSVKVVIVERITNAFIISTAGMLTKSLIDLLLLSEQAIQNGKLAEMIKSDVDNAFCNMLKPNVEQMSIIMTEELLFR